MPRTCTTCTHPHRDEIDRRLLDGAPLRNKAERLKQKAEQAKDYRTALAGVRENEPSARTRCASRCRGAGAGIV